MQLNRPIQTRFRYGSTSLRGLTLLHRITSRLIKQKARGHPAEAGLPLLVSTWFQVLFHSPSRSSFHLSLTVLVHYRSQGSI